MVERTDIETKIEGARNSTVGKTAKVECIRTSRFIFALKCVAEKWVKIWTLKADDSLAINEFRARNPLARRMLSRSGEV